MTHYSIPVLDQWFSYRPKLSKLGSMVQWFSDSSQHPRSESLGSVTHHSIQDLKQWFSDSSQHPRLGSMVQWLITASQTWIKCFSDSSQHPRLGLFVQWLITASQTWINGSVTHHSIPIEAYMHWIAYGLKYGHIIVVKGKGLVFANLKPQHKKTSTPSSKCLKTCIKWIR